MAALEQVPNLVTLLAEQAERRADQPFLWAKRDGVFKPWSWRETASQARLLARALRAQGLGPGDRVLLVSENRPEWAIADLAIMWAGGITVPAYTTNTTADHAYLLEHSGATVAIVSDAKLAARLLPAVAQAPEVRLVIAMEPLGEVDHLAALVVDWRRALALGESAGAADASAGEQLRRHDTACFIYTSGTGGTPKGVMLSHGNILANVAGACDVLRTLGLDDEVFLSFLPLSHAYEHTAGQFLPMAVGAQIYYADGIEGLSADLQEVRPTIMACVPRLYEVMRLRIVKAMARESGMRGRLFDRAVALGARSYERPGSLRLHERLLDRALDKLVRDKVRARFGGRMKALVSGGAPLNYDIGLFFTALGLPLLQGYGQTECAPVVSVNTPHKVKLHTVGPPLPGIEVEIAPDGEILLRGDSVMQGYWRDEDATRRTLQNGWLHTGDVGLLDEDGFLQITDRKKDIIVNSGGDNLAPQRVEGVLELEPEIAQAIVYGDRKPHLVALIVPDAEFATAHARQHGLEPDLAGLIGDDQFRRAIGEAVDRANARLSQVERIRRFELLAEPFSIEDGTMTPTLKLKRPIIYSLHRDRLEALYGAQR